MENERFAIGLMEKLCEVPSPSGEEAELVAFIADSLSSYGFEPIVDGGNVILPSPTRFYVTTHLDSVGEPKFSFDGRFFYGNSVCDAKASITAILIALSKLGPENLRFGIALFTDEEAGGTGSKRFVKKYGPEMAIVMEPTSLTVANVHYGNLEVEILAKCDEAHGSMHERPNAIELCIETIQKVRDSVPIKPAVLKITGGSDDYVIPAECKAVLDFLVPPSHTVSEILEKMERLTSQVGVVLKAIEICEPFGSERVHEILAKSMEGLGLEVRFSEMKSWTDGVNLKETADIVVWGPGDLEFCHTEKERVELREILVASEVLTNLNEVLESEKVF
jgi:acetylornithine deacetylase